MGKPPSNSPGSAVPEEIKGEGVLWFTFGCPVVVLLTKVRHV